MRLTKDYIESKQTPRGGYSKSQLQAWGVPWPPPKGWKAKLIKEKREVNEPPTPIKMF